MKDVITKDKKLEVLNQHYTETVSSFDRLARSRDRSFILLLVLLAIMSFQLFSPDQSESVLTQFAQKKLDIDASLSITYISSILWFSIFAVAIRYFQTVINLEKLYNYVHRVEDELAKHFSGSAFTREGKTYLKNYPKFSDWANFMYRGVFPLLFIIAITVKMISEWSASGSSRLPILLDTGIYILITVSTILYVYSLHKMQKDNEGEA